MSLITTQEILIVDGESEPILVRGPVSFIVFDNFGGGTAFPQFEDANSIFQELTEEGFTARFWELFDFAAPTEILRYRIRLAGSTSPNLRIQIHGDHVHDS